MLPHLAFCGGTGVCTSLFLRNYAGQLLLGLRHYDQRTFKGLTVWTTPGGRCGQGESVGDNLLREADEETGITEIILDGFVGITAGAKDGDTLYIYTGLTRQEPRLMEPHKFSTWRWFDPAEVPADFINHSALRLYRMYLDRPSE